MTPDTPPTQPVSWTAAARTNQALCNQCGLLVPAETSFRDDQVYLIKHCPACGDNETMISGDARRYRDKHELDLPPAPRPCALDCLACRHKQPNIVFLDVTNRCNLNCPCCINNTPSMGFLFEPPLSYFERIFQHYAAFDPPPSFQLFGGEPTVREDLFEIIRLARQYGIPVRLVTNGIKLADAGYCERLVRARVTVLLSFDGQDGAIYRTLRGTDRILAQKQQALDNLNRLERAKVTLMTLVARHFNDQALPGLFDFCHDRRQSVRAIYFMPLAHTWDPKDFDLEPERITGEDIEALVDQAFPDVKVDFLPAGYLGALPTVMKHLGLAGLPFLGAHPNCESMYLLLSDGEHYVPMAHYLKTDVKATAKDFRRLEERLTAREQRWRTNAVGRLLGRLRLRQPLLRLGLYLGIAGIFRRHARTGAFLKGRGLGKVWHGAAVLGGWMIGRRTKRLLRRHSRAQNVLQIIVLPFEDPSTIETDRLQRCPTAFAYFDPATDEVHHVPVCAWPLHKARVMRHISDHYGTVKAGTPTPSS